MMTKNIIDFISIFAKLYKAKTNGKIWKYIYVYKTWLFKMHSEGNHKYMQICFPWYS